MNVPVAAAFEEHESAMPVRVKVPRDPEDPRYVQSFEVADASGILSFFQRFGFAVVRVLNASECQETMVAAGTRRCAMTRRRGASGPRAAGQSLA